MAVRLSLIAPRASRVVSVAFSIDQTAFCDLRNRELRDGLQDKSSHDDLPESEPWEDV
jgi:hypothetical protein